MKLVVQDARALYQRLKVPQINQSAMAALQAQVMKKQASGIGSEEIPLSFEYRPEIGIDLSPARLPPPMEHVNLNLFRSGEGYSAMVRFTIDRWAKGNEFKGFSNFLARLFGGRGLKIKLLDDLGIGYVYRDDNKFPFASIDGGRVNRVTYVRDISIGFRGAESRVLGSEGQFEQDIFDLGAITNNYVNAYLSFCEKRSKVIRNPHDLTILLPNT